MWRQSGEEASQGGVTACCNQLLVNEHCNFTQHLVYVPDSYLLGQNRAYGGRNKTSGRSKAWLLAGSRALEALPAVIAAHAREIAENRPGIRFGLGGRKTKKRLQI